jgi:hypothetical protein
MYFDRVLRYHRLLKAWISWAVWNDIPLEGLDNLPDARWYLWKSRVEKWAANYLQFGKVIKDCIVLTDPTPLMNALIRLR